jgi:hypothetical protein
MTGAQWATAEKVLDLLGTPAVDAEDTRFLDLCVGAANQAIAVWRPDLVDATPVDHPMIQLGTTMIAMAWFQRRSGDVAAFAEFGGPPPAIGRDIEQLLRINRAAGPVIA